jgi:HlyD family secretion protein
MIGRSREFTKLMKRFGVLIGLAGVVAGTCLLAVSWNRTSTQKDEDVRWEPILHVVSRDDVPIIVKETGYIVGSDDASLRCQVNDVPGDGIYGTRILWMISNGALVKAGDLLVELDRSHHLERLERQILKVDQSRAARIQAQSEHVSQLLKNSAALTDTGSQARSAELDLENFEAGTHASSVAAIQQRISLLEQEVRLADAAQQVHQAALERVRETVNQAEQADEAAMLRRQIELDRQQFAFNEAALQHASKQSELRQARAELAKENLIGKKGVFERKLALELARRKVEQARRGADAGLRQAQAAFEAASQALVKHEELLTRYRKQLDACRIYAPTDGMVVHHQSGHDGKSRIREGSVVRVGQLILSITKLRQMQLVLNIPQDVVEWLKVGSPATIRVLAHPGRTYQGTVHSVSVLPEPVANGSSWSDVAHRVIVRVDGDPADLKPGMTGIGEIHAGGLQGVIIIPDGAVVRGGAQAWCYVQTGQGLELRRIELGRRSDCSIEILHGLVEGDVVVANPRENDA